MNSALTKAQGSCGSAATAVGTRRGRREGGRQPARDIPNPGCPLEQERACQMWEDKRLPPMREGTQLRPLASTAEGLTLLEPVWGRAAGFGGCLVQKPGSAPHLVSPAFIGHELPGCGGLRDRSTVVNRPDSTTRDSSNLPHFQMRMWPKCLRRGHQGRKGSPKLQPFSWAHRPFLSASQ